MKYYEEIKQVTNEKEIHVLALNEIRLDSSVLDFEVEIPLYSIIRKDRDRNGGGVALYVHESIQFKSITHDSLSKLEALSIQINLKNTKPVLFLNW